MRAHGVILFSTTEDCRFDTMTDTPSSYEQLRDRFTEECVLPTLSRAAEVDDATVLLLDTDIDQIYQVLTTERGSPDSGWFVIALGGPKPNDPFVRLQRIHDSDAHHTLLVEDTEIITQLSEKPPAEGDVARLIEQLQRGDRDFLDDALSISATTDMRSLEIVHRTDAEVDLTFCFDFTNAYQSTSETPVEFIDIFSSREGKTSDVDQ